MKLSVINLVVMLLSVACTFLPQKKADSNLLWHRDIGYISTLDYSRFTLANKGLYVTKYPVVHYNAVLRLLSLKTGKELWEITPAHIVLHSENKLSPLFIINRKNRNTIQKKVNPYLLTNFSEIDVNTGQVKRKINIIYLAEQKEISINFSQFFFAENKIIYTTLDKIGAIDTNNGRVLWEVEYTPRLNHPPLLQNQNMVVLNDRIIISYRNDAQKYNKNKKLLQHYKCYDLATGNTKFTFQTLNLNNKIIASPDKKWVYVQDDKKILSITKNGNTEFKFMAKLKSVSNKYVAVVSESKKPNDSKTLQVFSNGSNKAKKIATIQKKTDYFSAIKLYQNSIYYFTKKSRSLWQHNLDKTLWAKTKVLAIKPKFALGTDASGVSPARLGNPPIIYKKYLLIENWGLKIYKLD